MKPLFTQDQLKMFRTPGNVRRINGRLLLAQQAMRPLHFRDLTLRCQFIHIGPGLYTRQWDPKIHRHPDLQLEFVLSGQFRFVVSDRDFNLHSGHGLFIPPDVRHTWKAVAQGALLGVLLEVKGEEREVFLARAEDAMTRGKGLLLSRDARSLIRDVFCRLSARSIELGGIDEIAALLDLFHIELIRAQFGLLRWQPMASGSGMATDAVQRAMQLAEGAMRFIESNYMHPVRLRDIALHVGVSERHVNRVFQERYKATINKTLLRVRLERAFRMLSEHQEYSITAIAHDTGFSSAAYFARCFKQAYGMSPLKAQGR